ncbi:MAG: CrcB family protein, partial [Pirellulales bacterium]|nr:CrcB family protein [Pirellulales bacterium]
MTFSHAIWLAVGGGLGTLSRVLVIMLAVRLCGRDFPWGTFVVNLFGSFLFGIIVALGRGRLNVPAGLETILLVGFLGGFTTYSSFAFQSYDLFQEGRPVLAGAYMVGTTISGLAAV